MELEHEFSLDWPLLQRIARRRVAFWAIAGPVLAGLLSLAALRYVPTTFRATASVSLQQTTGPTGALATLAGVGGSTAAKKYLGVIRSRRFAAAAARATNLQALYPFTTPQQAAALVQRSVSLEDKNDGLLYLSVTLPGPPRLSAGANRQQGAIRQAAKNLVDQYVGSLLTHLATSNTDSDVALVRQAKSQLQKARQDYDDAVRALSRFAQGAPPDAAAKGPDNGGAAAAAAGSELQALYLEKGRLEVEMRAGDTTRAATARVVAGDLDALIALPGEDPLLAETRREVRVAASALENLRIDLSEENPEVVTARERLRRAENRLRRETQALRSGNTSDTIRQEALQTRYAALDRQIAAAERRFSRGRNAQTALEERRNEVMLRLEVLKTVAAQQATLSVQIVAGDSRMDVIDPAQVPAAAGAPAAGALIGASLFATLFVFLAALVIEYGLKSRSGRASVDSGSGGVVVALPRREGSAG